MTPEPEEFTARVQKGNPEEDLTRMNETKLPLEGIRVLDLTHHLAGPTFAMFMGDWGADVLKIEWWYRMDLWRGTLTIDDDLGGKQIYNKGRKLVILNRSKRGVTLNLKTDEGKRLFKELAKHSDVVADNFSANVMDRLGLGFDVLSKINPGICMVSMPAFGNSGPDSKFVGNGNTIEAYGGMTSMTGFPGLGPRNTVDWPDQVAGIYGTAAIAMALLKREKTGRGQCIELSQTDALVNMIGDAVLDYTANGTIRGLAGNSDIEMAPHGVYPCSGYDRWITIAVATDQEWEALCRVAGDHPWTTDRRFSTPDGRRKAADALDQMIGEWTSTQETWDLTERLQKAGVAAAPVTQPDDFLLPDFPAQGFVQHVEYDYLKEFPGPAARLNGQVPQIRRGPPKLGEHTEEVLAEILKLTDTQLSELREAGVI